MKKILLVFFTTLGLTLVFYKGYIKNIPLIASFNIQTEKDIHLEVKYTSKKNEEFKGEIGTFKNIPSGKSKQSIQLPINSMYKFRLDPGEYPGNVIISDITISSGSKVIHFDNFSEFGLMNISQKNFYNSRIELYSDHIDPYFWYLKPFEIKAQKTIDWDMLGIVFILSSLISFSFINFIYNFFDKYELNKKINTIFCTIFCLLLIIPTIHIDKREISTEENRKLAIFPHLIIPNLFGFNYNFGREFDSWIQDRFNGRNFLIREYDNILNIINGYVQNSVAIMYKNGWMFYKPWAEKIFSYPLKNDINKIKDNIIKVNNFCNKNNIKLYILICPIKEDIYYKKNIISRYSSIEQNSELIKFLHKSIPDIQIIYPREQLKKLAEINEDLYFKTDTHQTIDGAYYINKPLIDEIKHDFPLINIPDKEKIFFTKYDTKVRVGSYRGNGYIYQVLDLHNEQILDKPYTIYELKNPSDLSFTENNLLERTSTYTHGYGSAVLLGDSYTENQAFWLQFSFKHLLKIRANNMYENNEMRLNRWSDQIKKIHPDVLIICVSASDSFFHLKNLYRD